MCVLLISYLWCLYTNTYKNINLQNIYTYIWKHFRKARSKINRYSYNGKVSWERGRTNATTVLVLALGSALTKYLARDKISLPRFQIISPSLNMLKRIHYFCWRMWTISRVLFVTKHAKECEQYNTFCLLLKNVDNTTCSACYCRWCVVECLFGLWREN